MKTNEDTEVEIEPTPLDFVGWLMDNCQLADDNSLWSYGGDDYSNEKLYEIFKQSFKYIK